MKTYTVAIIGLGLIGIRHLKAVNASKNMRAIAIGDITPQSRTIANQYDIPHFDNIQLMIDSTKPDGIIIATPNLLHIPMAIQCIKKNIPILIEKPLATNITEAEEMLTLADAKQIPVLTGYFRRFNPVISTIKAQIENKSIGQIASIHCHFWLYKHKEYFDVEWRTEKQGGPIHINLAHDIDILLHLVGDIQQVTAYQSSQNRNLNVEDTAVIICQFSNGALGTINMSDSIPAPWSWELTAGDNPAYPQTDQSYCFIGGTHGSIELPKNKLWYYQDNGHWYTEIETKTYKQQIQDPLIAQIEHFADVLSGQSQPLVSGKDGLKVMKVIEAIKQSATSSQTIYL